jgi:hypothetical protein
VESFFPSCVSKFNAFMTLCTLGLTTGSLPVMAAPQEVCVKTLAGAVVCGTPVPKPPNSNQPGRAETIESQTLAGVTLKLKSCVRGARNNAICTFLLSSNEDKPSMGLQVLSSKLVDSSGKEYLANRVQVGDSADQQQVNFPMVKGADYTATLTFSDVPTSISKMLLLQVRVFGVVYYGTDLKFRNIPIN